MNKKNKDESVANKIYKIARMIGDLSTVKRVKCGVQNNFGHATILKIASGCNVRVHHMFDNTLSFDLLISPTAQDKYQPQCEAAKLSFEQLFSGKTKEDQAFIIPSREKEPHYRLWVDITNYDIDKIVVMIENIKRKFA